MRHLPYQHVLIAIALALFVFPILFVSCDDSSNEINVEQGEDNDNNEIDISLTDIGSQTIINNPLSTDTCDAPLATSEVTAFRNAVIGKLGLIRSSPLSVSRKQINGLTPLVEKVKENICYAEQMIPETSMLLRLYGSVIMLGTNDDYMVHPADPFKEGFPYIRKSKELNPELWQSELDRKAYAELEEAYKNLGKYNFTSKENLKRYCCNALTVMMIGAKKADIDEYCRKLAYTIDNALTENKDIRDLVYFLKSPIGETDYRLMMEAVKMIVVGSGGNFSGPEATAQADGYTLITYTTSGLNRNPTFEWLVDSEAKFIRANNEAARATEQGIAGKASPSLNSTKLYY